MKKRENGESPLLPNYQAVIVDEAHKLLQAAQGMYTTSISNSELKDLSEFVKGVRLGNTHKTGKVSISAYNMHDLNQQLFDKLNKNAIFPLEYGDEAEHYLTRIDRSVLKAMQNISAKGAVLDKLEELLNSCGVKKLGSVLYEINDIRHRLNILRQKQDNFYWMELGEGEKEYRLSAIPKKLDDVLNRQIWSSGLPIILTSGTLSVNGDFSRTSGSLGLSSVPIHKLREIAVSSPFDYKKNALMYISEKMPCPDNRSTAYISAVADEVHRLVMATRGRTAVLFTSYRVMNKVIELVRKKGVPYPLFSLNRGAVQEIEKFRKSGNGILFDSGALWEGIDLPGEILSSLIIVKQPFAAPSPLSELEVGCYSSRAEFMDRVIVPESYLIESNYYYI